MLTSSSLALSSGLYRENIWQFLLQLLYMLHPQATDMLVDVFSKSLKMFAILTMYLSVLERAVYNIKNRFLLLVSLTF